MHQFAMQKMFKVKLHIGESTFQQHSCSSNFSIAGQTDRQTGDRQGGKYLVEEESLGETGDNNNQINTLIVTDTGNCCQYGYVKVVRL